MKKTITIILAAITLLIALSSCDDSQQTTVLTLSSLQAESYFTTQGDLYFANLVEKETDGRVRIEVIAGGELYDNEADAYQAIKNGNLDFTHVTPSTMAEDEASLNVFLMPYLFDLPTGEGDNEFDQFETVIFGEIGSDLLSDIDDITGVEGLAFYDTGFRNFFSTTKIDDETWFNGKRIRTMDNYLMKEMITDLGATPYILQDGESLSDLLGNNTIQGAENNLLNYSVKQKAPNYLIDGHLRIPEILISSDAVRAKVGDADWAIIEACAFDTLNLIDVRDTMTAVSKSLAGQEEEILAELEADGLVSVIEPDMRNALRKKMNGIYTEYENSCGELVKRIESITSESN